MYALLVPYFSIESVSFFQLYHSEDVLPSIHADKYYPCELVGTWNTWYGEQDQAGRITNIYTVSICSITGVESTKQYTLILQVHN